ncbi:hypothetical protein MNBD_GAMMA21-843 [hydrothermal vent metagenome]|uniref:Uncharacterized protein n=1 Tax=hydrothermal vent metagenome TaxID=652676 RepID=A0A3B1AB49_9ZZZZ
MCYTYVPHLLYINTAQGKADMNPIIENRDNSSSDTPIQVVGAGPAGLATAITLARADRKVIVHEAQNEVGHRFKGDFQGLENWSSREDVLTSLECQGFEINFTAQPFSHGRAFDAWDIPYNINCDKPFFYLIERGPGDNTLDTGLLKQALALGVEVRFNDRVDQVDGTGILAAGPKVPDAIAVGYHFETDMPDGCWVICNDDLAPKGYAYLLVMAGRGTVKTCMFTGFKQEKIYLERTIDAFQRLVGLKMKNPQAHGGAGNFRIPKSGYSGYHPVVGEQAGFQDTLWGFGIRLAIGSGVLAAKSLLGNHNYDDLWHSDLRPQMQTAVINRALYDLLGNRGYRWFLRRMTGKKNVRQALYRAYQPSFFKRWLLPWALTRYESRRKDVTCNHIDCHCVWCRQCAA